MADAGSALANRPPSDLGLSGDEEDVVSNQSVVSTDRESRSQRSLHSALEKLDLDYSQLESPRSDHSAARSSTPDAGASVPASSIVKPERKKLELLDLPLDVLKEIVKEVKNTNDLTSLALTCSAFHNLTVPLLYTRFDIVWPEALNPSTLMGEGCSGVDALTFGLSTLVMGEEVFNQSLMPINGQPALSCAHCGCGDNSHRPTGEETQTSVPGFHIRRVNDYAQYTRKFSIGNGPWSWVQEYSVNREIGKMLGTLAALAIARMINLETFIWDMPTGVVREIWLALASLANRPGHECLLERVWVRWHDNSDNPMRPNTTLLISTLKNTHVERPSLSVLPPLKSVSVLDIDEPNYVEELATLIGRSRHRLTELRIGIAKKASVLQWARCAKPAELAFGRPTPWPKMGGVLSILSTREEPEHDNASTSSSAEDSVPLKPSTYPATTKKPKEGELEISPETNPSQCEEKQPSVPITESGPLSSTCVVPKPTSKTRAPYYGSQLNTDKLNLEVFELERVGLHVPTLLPNIEWTRLTTLTLLACADHENLWRALRRKYAPPPVPVKKQKRERRPSDEITEYSLNLKHLRTDNVSTYLMLFIKEAIAPNTLETVYLHEAPGYDSSVPMDAIYKLILRRHRLSLRKVLFDASERLNTSPDPTARRWQKWVLNQDMISFVTGRMPQLQELGMAMDQRNWHHFLQRLPSMSRLYALYLTHIGTAVHVNARELALQALDIVSIRPDLKLTYIALQGRCFQIREGGRDGSEPVFDFTNAVENPSDLDDEVEEDSTGPSGDHDSSMHDSDRLSNTLSDGYDTGPDDEGPKRVRFRLQEIIFYDEKISIFKARHGVI